MVENLISSGRFSKAPDGAFTRINASSDIDRRLYKQDIAGSIAHAEMLARCGMISVKDAEAIKAGLQRIEKEIAEGEFSFSAELEDIHMNIEAALHDKIGEAAGRLHMARSRNDQVATDFRLWVRDHIDQIDQKVIFLQKILIDRAEAHFDVPMPGFTHLQSAQPITFGHHLLAYVEMLGRDRGRLCDTRKRLNESPLGAAALAGTSFPIDRHSTAKALGFDGPMENSLDAVSSRDFALEYLGALAILGVHLSRLAEEIILWSSEAFAFIILDEAWRTGSSIMPQKRNPDAAELIRAKSGKLFGHMLTLFSVMKALPLAYAKDLQEDKPAVFDATDTITLCLEAMAGMMESLKIDKENMIRILEKGFPTATDLADWLVRVVGLPFRKAHHVTGLIVRKAEEKNQPLDQLSLEEMQMLESHITKDVFSVLSVRASLESRNVFGGTAPEQVKQAVLRARKRFLS